LLQMFPVRGITQAVIAWWYSANLSLVWFGLMGLATAFYLLPRITGRELSSHYLSLFVFWMLILFGSWTGIPSSAPVPAWMPVLSNIGTVLMLLGLIGLVLIIHQTLDGRYGLLAGQNPLRFTAVGLLAFMLVILMGVVEVFAGPGSFLQLTWFGNAKAQLTSYGFPAMVLFAGTYFILPRLVDDGLRFPKLARVQFWLATIGIALVVIPFAIAGFVESAKLAQPDIAFVDVSKSMLMFIRISTIGDLLILIANGLFLLNVAGTVLRYYRVQLQAGFSAVTIEASAGEVRS
ncbi:MAG TPA: cbb3-type cytochrome c oxidase subunit I, partial [Clostridia bacterium]|nr:cbb3-type cytochrome c oxidase subunit I [Clostridia bacterium]